MAKRKLYDWGNGPPVLENHSVCKHEIIGDYLIKYVEVVTKGFLRHKNEKFNITIVDGFAGGGKYLCHNKEIDGSPLVLIKAINKARQIVKFERENHGQPPININADFVFVDKDKAAVDFLNKTLRDEGRLNDQTKVYHGEFSDYLPRIIEFIKNKSRGRKGRAIFVLDQYGFSEVLLSQLKVIMASLNSEIILTFSVDSLVAFLCEKSETALKKIGFLDDDIKQIRHHQDDSNKCRGAIQHVLSKHIEGMSYYFTPFCIYGDTSHWGYWIVHLSNHYKARDVMTEIHWGKGNELVHYGGAGTDMFGYRSGQDEKYTGQRFLLPEFRFDSTAKERVRSALREEIPELLYEKGEISYGDLRNLICNHTPADGKAIRDVLWEGKEANEIKIKRQKAKNIQDNDIISIQRQMSIFRRK